jgi:hypothetical protein
VCAAAVEGDQNQWATAEAAAKTVPAGGFGSCLEVAAKALLQRALAWHERNPGRQPALRLPAAGSKTACPFRIDQVRLVDQEGQALEGPLEGSVTGGTLLLISGQGIRHPTQIRIAGQPADLVLDVPVDGSSIVVRTPPVDHPQAAQIRLRNRAGEVVAPVTFRYLAPGGAAG